MNIQSEPSLLSVDRLTIDLPLSGGVLHPVRGVSFTVRRGEALALVGESGCGKSLTDGADAAAARGCSSAFGDGDARGTRALVPH